MKLLRVLLAAPMFLCLLSDKVFADTESTTDKTLPPLFHGFVDKLIDAVHDKYIRNRGKNNESLLMFNQVWTDNVQGVSDKIKGLSDELKKVAGTYDDLHNLQNSDLPFLQKTTQLGALTAQLASSGLALLNNINSVLADVALKFGGLIPLITGTVSRNVIFAKDVGVYVPTEIKEKVMTLLNEIRDELHHVKMQIVAALEQVEILLTRISVRTRRMELPIQRVIYTIKTKIKQPLVKALKVVKFLEKETRLIALKVRGIFGYGVDRVRAVTSPIRNVLSRVTSGVHSVRNKIKNIGKNVRNFVKDSFRTFMGLLRRKPARPAITGSSSEPNNQEINPTTKTAELAGVPTTPQAP